MGVDRWLEFGVISGLLITVVTYILRYHMPTIIKSFREGMGNVARAMKDVNKTLVDLKLLVTLKTEKATKDCQQACQHARERNQDAFSQRLDDLEKEIRALTETVNKLRASIDRFLT